MVSKITISAKLKKLKEYTNRLEGYQDASLEEIKKDYTLQGAILHYLQIAIESTMDVGEMIISELKLRKPQEGSEIFFILAEHKVIPQKFAKRFAPAVNFRNLIVHEYAEIDLKKVYKHLKDDLRDFDFFAQCIANFLKKRNKF